MLCDDRRVSADLRAENERLQSALQARLEEVEALRRVATLVARNAPPEDVLDLVTREVARHLKADAAMTARFDGPGVATVLSDWAATGLDALEVPAPIELDPGTVLEQIQQTGRPARTDSYEDIDGAHAEEVRELGMRAGVGRADRRRGRAVGRGRRGQRRASRSPRTPSSACTRSPSWSARRSRTSTRASSSSSRAPGSSRRPTPRAASSSATCTTAPSSASSGSRSSLRLLTRRLGPEAGIEPCIQELLGALEELRDLARGLHPAVLTERGLVPALEALAARSPVPATVVRGLGERLPEAQEVALYFVAAEALANVAKYADATEVEIRVERTGEAASIAIADDGIGGASPDGGSGLRGLPTASRRSAAVCASTARAASARPSARGPGRPA